MKKKLGIICAMDEELAPLKEHMKNEDEHRKASMAFFAGDIEGRDVVMVVSGIGKVNAAICAQILIDDYQVTHLLNVGVAGGVKETLKPMDIIIATSLVQHDMDVRAFGLKRGEIPRMETSIFIPDPELNRILRSAAWKYTDSTVHEGRIVSGDAFISSKEKIMDLLETFEASACEMEGASIAHVAYLNEIPFAVVRAISDNANTGASMDYEKFKDQAARSTVSMVLDLLKNF